MSGTQVGLMTAVADFAATSDGMATIFAATIILKVILLSGRAIKSAVT